MFPILLTSVLVLLSAAGLGVTANYTALSPLTIDVCATGTNANTYRQARFMALNYSNYAETEWPLLNFTDYRLLVFATDKQPPDAVRAYFDLKGQQCDVIIGPASSTLAQAFSPILSKPVWIDYAATSVDLSDKNLYPTFARVVTSDATSGGVLVRLAQYFGYTKLNFVLTGESYGRSVTSYVADNFLNASAANTLGATVELKSAPSDDEVANALKTLAASDSRVVVVAFAATGGAMPAFFRLAAEMQESLAPSERFIFLLSESSCSSMLTWQVLTGAICASFGADPALWNPFWSAFAARDRTADVDFLTERNFTDADITTDRAIAYSYLAVDAVRFALTALNKFVAQYQRKPASTAEMFAFMVAGSKTNAVDGASGHRLTDGMTGLVRLSSTGDRVDIYSVILAATGNNVTLQVGTATASAITIDHSLLYEGGEGLEDFMRGSPSTKSSSAGLIAGLVVGACVLAAAVLGYGLYSSHSAQRRSRFAPKDEVAPYTIVFTDIQSSTTMWAREPALMGAAIDCHHHVIRQLIAGWEGYEVKTAGDSFMIAFKNAADAVEFALRLQEELNAVDWIKLSGGKAYDAFQRTYQDIQDETNQPPQKGEFHGLRVRVGVHSGFGLVRDDVVAGIVDYYGTVVNCAARVEAVGNGGQVLVTDAALRLALRDAGIISPVESGFHCGRGGAQPAIGLLDSAKPLAAQLDRIALPSANVGPDLVEPPVAFARKERALPQTPEHRTLCCRAPITEDSYLFPASCFPTSFASVPLRGLDEPVNMVQLLPRSLAIRTFAPLRVEVEAEVADVAVDDVVITEELGGRSAIRPLSPMSNAGNSIISHLSGDEVLVLGSAATTALSSDKEKVTVDSALASAHVVRVMTTAVLNTILSPLAAAQQERLLKEICGAWRLSTTARVKGSNKSAHSGSAVSAAGVVLDDMIAVVAARTASIVMSQRRKK
jgi:class 3 adenylate cyclase